MDYSQVIIHPRFIHYFTLRQASTRSTGTRPPCPPFSYVYEHFSGNGKCREFAEVSRYKARAAESKSNLRCSRCIGNSFRLRRLTPSSFAVKYGWDDGSHRKGVDSRRVDIINFELDWWRLSSHRTTPIFSSVCGKRVTNIRSIVKKINRGLYDIFAIFSLLVICITYVNIYIYI